MNGVSIPLNKDEFAAALAKGLGRAKQYVDHHGLDEVADIVMDACLHNRAYDSQCESSRTTWLTSMFEHSPHRDKFHIAILSALATETGDADVQQLCELALGIAKQGHCHARQSLQWRVFEIANQHSHLHSIGADEWIALEGVDGFLELARCYGQRLLRNPDDWVPESLTLFYEQPNFDWKHALIEHSTHDPTLKIYFEYLQKQGVFNRNLNHEDNALRAQAGRERFRRDYPLARIIADARNHVGTYPGHYASFGRNATHEELEAIYTLLMTEVDESALARLLWVFRRTTLPHIDAKILQWATGANGDLRAAAIAALAHISDPAIHALARKKVDLLAISGHDCESLDLFIHNYQAADAELIFQALISTELDTDEIHCIGNSIISLAEQQGDPSLANLIMWAYEHTPCSTCRHRLVKQLAALQQLREPILTECLYDADPEIRALAAKHYPSISSREV